jgi:hypothetical protein
LFKVNKYFHRDMILKNLIEFISADVKEFNRVY